MKKERKMKKVNSNAPFMLLCIFLISIISIIMSFGIVTYARYRQANSSQVDAQIARWSFKVNGEEEVFANILIEDTIHTENIVEKKIAPGTEGAINLDIDARGSEVSLMYVITISDMINKPENLKFYSDENYTEEIEIDEDGKATKNGYLLLQDKKMRIDEKVYWKWAYTTGLTEQEIKQNNIIDTNDQGKSMSAKITVQGIQIDDSDEIVGEEDTYYKENDEVLIPFKVKNSSFQSADIYKIASIDEKSIYKITSINEKPIYKIASIDEKPIYKIASIEKNSTYKLAENETDILGLTKENIQIFIEDRIVEPRNVVIEVSKNEGGFTYYNLKISGIKECGNIRVQVINGNYKKIIRTRYYIDSILPVMQVTEGETKEAGIIETTITYGDEHISNNNICEYYISNSNTELIGGEWKTYTNSEVIRIEKNELEKRYIWVKPVKDLAGNESETNITVEDQNYYVSGEFEFDIVNPIIKSGGPMQKVQEYEDGTTYLIPIEVVENKEYIETNPISNLTADEIQIFKDGTQINPEIKTLTYEKTVDGKDMYTLQTKLTEWQYLELKFNEGVIEDAAKLPNIETRYDVEEDFSTMPKEYIGDEQDIIDPSEPDGSDELDDLDEAIIEPTIEPGYIPPTVGPGGENPIYRYTIMNVNQLKDVKKDLKGYYVLGRDLDLSGEENWKPLGVNSTYKFSGDFDGAGHTIKNLNLNRTTSYNGLFGIASGSIHDLYLENVNVTGGSYTGALVGYSGGTLRNIGILNGTVQGTSTVGGLAGRGYNIEECYTDVEVQATGRNIGGLVGYQRTNILNCFSTSKVKGNDKVGGLVGYAYSGSITNCYAIGAVEGATNVGGLKGYNNGTRPVTNSYWCYETTGQASSAGTSIENMGEEKPVRELIKQAGYVSWSFGSIWAIDENTSFAYLKDKRKPNNVDLSNLLRTSPFTTGDGSVDNPYIIRTVAQLKAINYDRYANYELGANLNLQDVDWSTTIGNMLFPFRGKFEGKNYKISNLSINKTSNAYLGLFGKNAGTIQNLKLDNVTVSGKGYIGALTGYNAGIVNNVHATNINLSSTAAYAGGLTGYSNGGSIENCYTTGNVNSQSSNTGGLVGCIDSTNINKCYSNVEVNKKIGTYSGQSYVGGLVGYIGSNGNVSNSFALGNVQGYNYVGGLAGYQISGTKVENCYSIGEITASSSYGGLKGYSSGSTISSYYATDLSECTSSSGGTGKLCMEMQKEETFTNWQFGEIWLIEEDRCLPYLKDLPKPQNISFSYQNLASVAHIGDYVNYKAYSNGAYTYTTTSTITGTSTGTTTLNTSDKTKWKIINIDSNTGIVEIASTMPTTKTISLYGQTGYNNSEDILNTIGIIYGFGKGATGGRSLNISDTNTYYNLYDGTESDLNNSRILLADTAENEGNKVINAVTSISNGTGATNEFNLYTTSSTNATATGKVVPIVTLQANIQVLGRDTVGEYKIALEKLENKSNITVEPKVVAGYNHFVALKSDGTVWTWGLNNYGQLGLGDTTNRTKPTQVPGLTDVVDISANVYHTLLLKSDGIVLSTGYNNYGQLGNGTKTNSNTFQPVISNTGGILFNVQKIATGGCVLGDGSNVSFSYMLMKDGAVYACGKNNTGQLGLGNTTDTSYPLKMLNISNALDVKAGGSFTIILDENHNVWGCGSNSHGQLGINNTTNQNTLVQMLDENGSKLINVKEIECERNDTFILKNDGTVWGVGQNQDKQLGDGTTVTPRKKLVAVLDINKKQLSGISHIFSSNMTSFYAIKENENGMYVLGKNTYGELFTGNNTSVPFATKVLTDKKIICAIATWHWRNTYYNTGLVVDDKGNMYTAGYGANGELGNLSTSNSTTPICITTLQPNEKNINLKANEQFQIKLEIGGLNLLHSDLNNEEITYTSQNNQIATVNENGVIEAKSAGTTTITCYVPALDLKTTITVNVSI